MKERLHRTKAKVHMFRGLKWKLYLMFYGTYVCKGLDPGPGWYDVNLELSFYIFQKYTC